MIGQATEVSIRRWMPTKPGALYIQDGDSSKNVCVPVRDCVLTGRAAKRLDRRTAHSE